MSIKFYIERNYYLYIYKVLGIYMYIKVIKKNNNMFMDFCFVFFSFKFIEDFIEFVLKLLK